MEAQVERCEHNRQDKSAHLHTSGLPHHMEDKGKCDCSAFQNNEEQDSRMRPKIRQYSERLGMNHAHEGRHQRNHKSEYYPREATQPDTLICDLASLSHRLKAMIDPVVVNSVMFESTLARYSLF